MPDQIRLESPLAGFETRIERDGLSIAERAFLGHLNLRGAPDSPRFRDAVERESGCALPLVPNTFAQSGETYLCWLGPNEWLLLCDAERKDGLLLALQGALRGLHFALTDVSSSQTVLTLAGPRARDLLAQGCPLDLHPRAFAPGRCAQSYLARAAIVLLQTAPTPAFELIVRRSFTPYLWRWLTK